MSLYSLKKTEPRVLTKLPIIVLVVALLILHPEYNRHRIPIRLGISRSKCTKFQDPQKCRFSFYEYAPLSSINLFLNLYKIFQGRKYCIIVLHLKLIFNNFRPPTPYFINCNRGLEIISDQLEIPKYYLGKFPSAMNVIRLQLFILLILN